MATQPNFISVEDYLASEETSEDRHEYRDGEVFLMAGGSPPHADIISNILTAVKPQLKGTGYRVRTSDMRVRTSPTGLYTYPDVVISCKPEQLDRTTLLNPIVIVEVLSRSTQDYDRGSKFERYRQIPSLREYIIVAQDRLYVEHHVRRTRDNIVMTEHTSLEDSLSIDAVNVVLRFRKSTPISS